MKLLYRDIDLREKRGIQRFSEQIQKDVGFKRINQDKDLGEFWGDFFLGRGIGFEHQVTGKELNELRLYSGDFNFNQSY